MSPGFSLLAHSCRRIRNLILSAGALMAGFQLLFCLAARAAQELNAYGSLSALVPDFLRQLMGPSLFALMSFSGIVCVGYFHFISVCALMGLTIAIMTEVSAEIEIGFIDLILSRPLARHWLITRSIVLLVGCSVVLLCAMVLGSALGLYFLAPPETVSSALKLIRSLVFNLEALILCWGGLALAIASISRRRSVASAVTGSLALSTYLFDYVAQIWQPGAKIAWLFPFHYYNALKLITSGEIPTSDIGILLSYGIVGMVFAYILFSRRDV
jgi:ABC-2 type transport system permease protein